MDSLTILLATLGSAGDVLPFIHLGQKLKQRGHRVALTTHAAFAPTVEKSGLDFSPIGTADDYREGLLDPKLFHPREAFATLSRLAILPLIEPIYEFVRSRFEPGRTRVVALPHCFGARIAQEKWGIPTATAVLQPCVLRSLHDTPRSPAFPTLPWTPAFLKGYFYRRLDRETDAILAPGVNEFRRKVDLEPVQEIMGRWRFSPDLILGLFPEWFAKPQPDWLPQTRLTTFPLDPEISEPLAPEIISFLAAGERPIIFSPGTALRDNRQFFQDALSACESLKRRAIFLTTFADQLPAQLPSSILHVSWAPLKALLPHGAAFVHSAGIGAGSLALACGIPQVVIPLAFDQPDNAERFRRLHTAIVDKPGSARLATHLDRLLKDPQFSNASRQCAERLKDKDPYAPMCELIEGMAN